MTQDTQVLLAILLYLAFFAWIGFRRGFRSELTVFIVALLAWVVLQERGNIFVALTNMVVSFGALFGASLASGTVDQNNLSTGSDFVQPGGEETFLFLLWIIILFLTYYITSRPGFAKSSKKTAWAAIVGALNGFNQRGGDFSGRLQRTRRVQRQYAVDLKLPQHDAQNSGEAGGTGIKTQIERKIQCRARRQDFAQSRLSRWTE